MEASLEGSLLKKVFDSIKEMVSDVNLECAESGIQIQAMDPSHVSLVALNLPVGAFANYRCDHVRTLGLNMAAVTKVFKLCGNDDRVIIRNQSDTDYVSFVFESVRDDKVSDFELKLMQVEEEHLGIPATDFMVQILMPSRHFQKVVADLGQFSDTIQIETTPKAVKFTAKGDIGSGNTLYKASSSDAGDKIEIKCNTEGATLMFATRYLTYFTKAASLADYVQLRMTPRQPLEVTYHLNNNEETGTLKFYLAPKMDENMED
eukprot:Protomagalhaensia_wolfi_Nauph_80__2473@NODE_2642_length_1031_cov_84_847782_g2069_i0_p1_GENE_NODE_2642_length_1031_cov_84_847782_g2069_i0NODE_2642_length_1031_cov_84_847782_g2069_i0_p1_ORF_typecomplete_len262_score41_17PCNA_N/PF00705_18/2_8e38PCNA_N/PF00705_18/1_4e02PCNA_N/PF00705_18/4_2e02PCNA_C/PF02747_15/2_7e02PCNA_C/PF02747_15/6_6e03PCNA_C/PF02747_15/9_2e34Rad1/PF02144_16/5_3e13Rad9/PF04139_13/1_7e07AadA_C/PF18280_1/0_17NAGLU_N/PF12971_7/3_3e03NAGLU_N/PF12971_7/0_39_NODE_2642_length_1031_cov_